MKKILAIGVQISFLIFLCSCTSVRLADSVTAIYPDLRVKMLSETSGYLYHENRPEQINFNLGSRIVSFNQNNIYLSDMPILNEDLYLTFKPNDIDIIAKSLLDPKPYQKVIKTIVIDPGHGGTDTGARGKFSEEKAVNLKISKKLKTALEKRGIKVILLRNNDQSLSLQERCDMANRLENIDLFLSIHQNSASNRGATGIETFVPEKIFSQSSVNDDNRYNFLIACNLQNNLSKIGATPNRGVKHAKFFVLRNTNMPAILIECGFISNESEEKLINDNAYQDKIVQAITDGLIFFEKN